MGFRIFCIYYCYCLSSASQSIDLPLFFALFFSPILSLSLLIVDIFIGFCQSIHAFGFHFIKLNPISDHHHMYRLYEFFLVRIDESAFQQRFQCETEQEETVFKRPIDQSCYQDIRHGEIDKMILHGHISLHLIQRFSAVDQR